MLLDVKDQGMSTANEYIHEILRIDIQQLYLQYNRSTLSK